MRRSARLLLLALVGACEAANPAYLGPAARRVDAGDPPLDARTDAPSDARLIASGSSLKDDFGDGVLGPLWTPVKSGDCTISEPNGRLRFLLGGGQARCAVRSKDAFDLRRDGVVVRIDPITNFHPGMWVFVSLAFETGESLQVGFLANRFEAVLPPPATPPAPVDYSRTAVFWRLRDANRLSFESSADGKIWRSELDLGSGWPLDVVHVELGVEVRAPMPAQVPLHFDAVNPS